jgi:hypothetical protein
MKGLNLKDVYTELRRSDLTLDIWQRKGHKYFFVVLSFASASEGNFFLRVWPQLATFEHLSVNVITATATVQLTCAL